MLNKRELSMLALACAIFAALLLTGHADPVAARPSPLKVPVLLER